MLATYYVRISTSQNYFYPFTLVGNKIIDQSDVLGAAAPLGAAPTTSSS